jgi:glucuronokinase
VIAWRHDAAATSGDVHARLRERHRRGEALIREAIAELASVARLGREALEARDPGGFARSVDRTFDLRAEMLELDPRCVEMVSLARRAGAAANYTGSGGAIIAACQDERQAGTVAAELERAGCGVTQYAYPYAP